MTTLFKKIIDKKISADIVYEDHLCIAFRDIQAQAPTHILLIPKKEIKSLEEISSQDQLLMGHLVIKASEIAKNEGLKGYRIVINTNKEGGQQIYHLHLHIIGGRPMTWPPG